MKGKVIDFDKTTMLLLVKMEKQHRVFHKSGELKKDLTVKIEIEKPVRSLEQNAFYWKFLDFVVETYRAELYDFVNPTPMGLHELFKNMARYRRAVPSQFFTDDGKISTAILDKYYFAIYLEEIVFATIVEHMHLDISEWERNYVKYKESQNLT